MDISKSLFSLVKTNNGLFKSDKQSSFLTSFLDKDLTYFTSRTYNLGIDYSFKKCGSASFMFYLDQQGVYKVVKETSKGKQSIYFERKDQVIFEAEQAEKQKQLQRDLEIIRLERKRTDIVDRTKAMQDRYLSIYIKSKNLDLLTLQLNRLDRLKANSVGLIDGKLKDLI